MDEGRHEYREYRAFGRHAIILCDFCDVDFQSYMPSYFGLPDGRSLGNALDLVRTIDPRPYPIADGYCETCAKRLAFLKFLADVRRYHEP